MWENIARRLKGSLAALEPREPHHEQGLFEAAQDPRIWQFLPFDAGEAYYPAETSEGFHTWMRSALAGSEAGNEAAFATLDTESGEPVGSTATSRFVRRIGVWRSAGPGSLFPPGGPARTSRPSCSC